MTPSNFKLIFPFVTLRIPFRRLIDISLPLPKKKKKRKKATPEIRKWMTSI
jgi:hypothetical protein